MENSFNDIESFEKLFKTYFSPLVNFINSKINHLENSEEIVQSTFLKLWENRESLEINTSIKSYLYQSSKNTMIDFIRKSKIVTSELEESLENIPDNTEIELDPYVIRSQIELALSDLKEKNQQIFRLNKFEGLTYKEIAKYLDMSERGVEDNIARATKHVKEKLINNKIFDI